MSKFLVRIWTLFIQCTLPHTLISITHTKPDFSGLRFVLFLYVFLHIFRFVWKWLWYKCLHKITPLILRNCGQIFWVEVSKQNIQKIDTNKLIKELLPKCGIFSMLLNLNKKVFFHGQFCFRLLTVFWKMSILDVWLDSEYVSEQWSQEYQKQH